MMALMDSHMRGTLWLIPFLLTVSRLTCSPVCPTGCLCHSSGAVKCVGDIITAIPEDLPTHTYLLQLNDTKMEVIDERSLANHDLLLRFSLTHSHLHTIHPKAFNVAPQLKSVKLSSNDLSTLPAGVFIPLTDLEQLHLDGNQLEAIAPDMLEGLSGLRELDLSRNKLSNPASDAFDGLTNLTFLNIGRNGIKMLPPTIFHSLINLRELSMYYNELEALESGIFDRLVNLEVLKIHQNHISSLAPEVFWPLTKLKTLTLSSNRLQAIPEKSFYHLPKLSKLTLYKNPLLSLPDQLMGHMPEMRELYLYETNLTTVPGNLFANMSGLQVLNLHLNDKLMELPSDLFCCLPHLIKLSLKSNNLHYLPPHLFSKLTTLSILLLNNNKLQRLSENIFQGLGALATLDLKNNNLRTLPGDIFSSSRYLRVLMLSENPWDCTCSIRAIAHWMKLHKHIIPDRSDVMCHSPVYQLLRTLDSLEDEFICDTSTVKGDKTDIHEPTQPFIAFTTKSPAVTTSVAQTTQIVTTSAYFQIQTTPLLAQTIPGTTVQTDPPPPTTTSVTEKRRRDTTEATGAAPMSTTSHVLTLPTYLHPQTSPLPSDDFLLPTETPSQFQRSPPFYNKVVLEQGPDFVHHSHHKAWVYVWFVSSDPVRAGLLMFCHILFVVTGLVLILAAMYGVFRLNKAADELVAECARSQV